MHNLLRTAERENGSNWPPAFAGGSDSDFRKCQPGLPLILASAILV